MGAILQTEVSIEMIAVLYTGNTSNLNDQQEATHLDASLYATLTCTCKLKVPATAVDGDILRSTKEGGKPVKRLTPFFLGI